MSQNNIPPYEIISCPIKPPVGENHFGAKPMVASSHHIQSDDPWNKEFWGKTEQEAIARAQMSVDNWARGET